MINNEDRMQEHYNFLKLTKYKRTFGADQHVRTSLR